MNIVHLLSSKVWSGTARYAHDLAATMRRRGHHVEVFTRGIEAVSKPFAKDDLWAGQLRIGGWWDVVSRVSLANRLNHLSGRTVVHVYNLNDAAVATAARRLSRNAEQVRVVLSYRQPQAIAAKQQPLMQMLDAVVVESSKTFANEPWAAKCREVPTSVIAPARQVTPVEPEHVGIIFARPILPGKGLDVVIRALADLTELDWRLTVCGEGSGRDAMPAIRLARGLNLNDRIQWLGHVEDIYPEMQKCQIAVAADTQPCGMRLTVLEALSQGLAVVASDAANEQLQAGQQALITPAGDVKALADALRKLITDSNLRQNIGASGYRRFITERDYAKMVDSIETIYHEC